MRRALLFALLVVAPWNVVAQMTPLDPGNVWRFRPFDPYNEYGHSISTAGDLATRLGPQGTSSSTTGFGLSCLGRNPAGREVVRLACEVKPYQTPFDGAGVLLGDWTDTGVPAGAPGSSIELTQAVGGLSSGTAYHWWMKCRTSVHNRRSGRESTMPVAPRPRVFTWPGFKPAA